MSLANEKVKIPRKCQTWQKLISIHYLERHDQYGFHRNWQSILTWDLFKLIPINPSETQLPISRPLFDPKGEYTVDAWNIGYTIANHIRKYARLGTEFPVMLKIVVGYTFPQKLFMPTLKLFFCCCYFLVSLRSVKLNAPGCGCICRKDTTPILKGCDHFEGIICNPGN